MQRYDRVAIVGVGLIGASIGLALRQRGLARHVVGIGRRSSTLDTARQRGAVTETTTDIATGVAEAQLAVVATPVAAIVPTVQAVAAACPKSCLLTDAGSTKRSIVTALQNEPRFIGSHPLAGSENSGPEHGRADLFDGRVVVLTPTSASMPDQVAELEAFWSSLGARVARMTAEEHDEALAATSHMPHLAAAAIAAATPKQYAALVASGWLDTTRIAAGDPQLWQQILLDNREPVLHSLGRLQEELAALQTALEAADPAQLELLLIKAKRTRDALGS